MRNTILRHGKYYLRFTGWKQEAGSIRLRAQWIAWTQEDTGVFYADTGGSVGHAGFGMQMHPGERIVTILTPKSEKSRIGELTLQLLKEYLDARPNQNV